MSNIIYFNEYKKRKEKVEEKIDFREEIWDIVISMLNKEGFNDKNKKD
ncbi:hypothetical protein JCM1393_25630 [Clostridium carnis]